MMKICPTVSHVDRRNLIAPPFSSLPDPIDGPYCIPASEVYLSGGATSQVYLAGSTISDISLG